MKLSKIGIPIWKMGPNSMGVTIPYLNFIGRYGEAVPLNPYQLSIREIERDYIPWLENNIDLLLLPGGSDVNTISYNEMPGYYTKNPDIYKESFDRFVVELLIKRGSSLPIFGICRGFQTLAVMHGAYLTQDLPDHPVNNADKRYERVHAVSTYDTGLPRLNRLISSRCGKKTIKVNSLHHQGVTVHDLLEQTTDLAIVASYDDVVEAFISEPHGNIAAVQYHPEELNDDPITDSLIQYLIFKERM